MTSLDDIALPRPAATPDDGPLDHVLYDLVELRARRLLRDNPIMATYLGIHTEDERLGDGSRDAVLQELADEREHLATVEALDEGGLSEDARFERDLEIHNTKLSVFETGELRIWERRATGVDAAGDALFLLFARDHAPLAERLQAISARLEALPAFLEESKSRAAGPQVRRWQQLELDAVRDVPSLFGEIQAAAEGVLDPAAGEAAGHRHRQGPRGRRCLRSVDPDDARRSRRRVGAGPRPVRRVRSRTARSMA